MLNRRCNIFNSRSSSILVFLIIISGISTGCEKVILSGEGKIITKSEIYSNFTKISFHDIWDVELISDSVFSVNILAYEKYIDKVVCSLDSGNISFSDKNPEKLLPEYPRPVVKISMPILSDMLFLDSPVRITSKDTLRLPKLNILTLGKTADIDILIDTENFRFTTGSDNSGYYLFSGNAGFSSIWHRGSSIVDAGRLKTKRSSVYNNSIGSCTVNVTDYLQARLNRTGNIYYFGDPEVHITEETATGKVIKLEEK